MLIRTAALYVLLRTYGDKVLSNLLNLEWTLTRSLNILSSI